MLAQENKISLWHKKDLLAGDEPEKETEKKFQEADVIVLFSSINYYTSKNYKREKEWALNKHYAGEAKVIQVKLLSTFPELENYNISHLPNKDSILSSTENKDIDVICSDIMIQIWIIAGLLSDEVKNETVLRPVLGPKGIRLFLDIYFPALHTFLTKKTGLFKDPGNELYDFNNYFVDLKGRIIDELYLKTYIHLSGTAMPSYRSSDFAENDSFNSTIQNEIRYIFGKSKGGDSENAQIAAKSRKNKLVKDVKKLLMRVGTPMILLGDPGTGKTMTIQQAILSIIEQNKNRIFPLVPVYIRLGEFNTKVFELEVVDEFIYRNAADRIKPYLRNLLQSNQRMVIFFDGMDEMSREDYNNKIKLLGRFADAHKNYCQSLFSCRINDFSSAFEYQRLVILPLGKLQIKKFLQEHKIQLPLSINNESFDLKKLVTKLSSGDLPMEADNPFILWLFCNFIQKSKRWPDSRVELMKSYVEEIYSIKTHDSHEQLQQFPKDVEAIFKSWGQFAFILSEENAGTSVPVNSLFDKFKSNEIVFRLIAAGKICNILRESRDGEEYLLKFEHQRFQEYFSAYYIYKQKLPIDWLAKLDSPRWQETMLNYLLLSNETNIAALLVSSINDDFENFKKIVPQKNIKEKYRKESQSFLLNFLRIFRRKRKYDLIYKYLNTKESLNSETEIESVSLTDKTLIESLLTDKIELGARLIKQLGAESELKNELVPILSETIYYVAENGNPISQGKMLLASQYMINDIDRHRITRATINSKISWIKNQAIILSTKNLTIKDNISDFLLEVGIGIIKGDIIKNFKAFFTAASTSQIPKIKRCIYSGLLIYIFKLVVLFAIAYGFICLNTFFFHSNYSAFFVQYRFVYLAIVLIIAIAAYKVYAEELWLFVLGGSVISIALTYLFFMEIYEKIALTPLLYSFSFFSTMYIVLPFIAYILSLLDRLYIGLFTVINWEKLDNKNIFSNLMGEIKDVYNTRAKFGIAFPAFTFRQIILYVVGFAVLMLLIIYIDQIEISSNFLNFLENHIEPFTKAIGLEYTFVIAISLITIAISIPFFGIIYILEVVGIKLKFINYDFIFFFMLIPGFGILMILMSYLTAFNANYSATLSIIMLVILVILAIVSLYFLSKKVIKILEIKRRIRKSKYSKNSFTEFQWKELLNEKDTYDQAEFIDKTEYFSIGLDSTKELLKLFVEIELLIKKENPAYETYWSKRKKLEEEVRQERT